MKKYFQFCMWASNQLRKNIYLYCCSVFYFCYVFLDSSVFLMYLGHMLHGWETESQVLTDTLLNVILTLWSVRRIFCVSLGVGGALGFSVVFFISDHCTVKNICVFWGAEHIPLYYQVHLLFLLSKVFRGCILQHETIYSICESQSFRKICIGNEQGILFFFFQ